MGRRARVAATGSPPPGLSEGDRCPHCGTIADVERSRTLRYRCEVCGGPRVPVDDASVTRSEREHAALEKANQLRFRRVGWWGGAVALAGVGALTVTTALAVLAIFSPGVLATAIGLGIALAPLAAAAQALRMARRLGSALEDQLDEAWQTVAADVLRTHAGELTAPALARALRVEEPEAERLLAQLNAHDLVRMRVTDDGNLLYEPTTRLRVAEPEPAELAADPEEAARATTRRN